MTELELTTERQELLDKALTGAAKQGWKQSISQDETVGCCYRGDNGLKCHVGQLIPDDQYTKDMETCSPLDLVRMINDEDLRGLILRQEQFLQDLQDCHDRGRRDQLLNDEDLWDHMKVELTTYNLDIRDPAHYEALAAKAS